MLKSVLDKSTWLIRNLTQSKGNLSQKALQGGFWVFFTYGGGRVLNIIRSIILARLLLPSDFGLMSLALIATGFLSIMTEVGIGPALIFKQEESEEVLNTAWLISLGRGLILCLFTILIARPVSIFFETPELTPILQVMAFTFIANGLNSTGLILLERELEFRKLGLIDLASNLLSLVVAGIAAWYLRNTWALVIGTFVQVLVVLVGSYLIHPFRPKLTWSSASARSILGYGKYIMGVQIVSYTLTQGDSALVGKILDTTQLGLYNMAYNLASLPATSISHVIGKVAFPAYAKIQHDLPALREAYFKVLRLTSVLAIPAAGGLFALAHELINLLYGEKWLPMVPAFMILSVYGLERAINSPVGPLFNATGSPKTVLRLQLIKLGLLIVFIVPLTIYYGIIGTSIAGGIVAILISANAIPLVAKAMQCSVSSILKQMVKPSIATVIMILSVFLIKYSGWVVFNGFTLSVIIILAVMVYFSILMWIDRPVMTEIKQIIGAYLKPAGSPVYPAPEA